MKNTTFVVYFEYTYTISFDLIKPIRLRYSEKQRYSINLFQVSIYYKQSKTLYHQSPQSGGFSMFDNFILYCNLSFNWAQPYFTKPEKTKH
jgi:hypothetical protein